MTACEAMTVATVARRTIGMRPHGGMRRKNGLSIARGEWRMREP